MFSFFRKNKNIATDLSALQCDMHSHILPGIDDGSPDTATSLRLIKGLYELGYHRLIATPHIFWDMYKNTPEIINERKSNLQAELRREGIPVSIHAAAEYYMDDYFESLVNTKQTFLTLHDKLVLVEFSFVTAPMDWKGLLFDLQMQGYTPVLAHPERYTYFAGRKQVFHELKDAGCLFQLNLLSLTGYYDKVSKELANYFIKNNMVSFLGTDMHNERHLSFLQTGGNHIMPALNSLLDSGNLMNSQLGK